MQPTDLIPREKFGSSGIFGSTVTRVNEYSDVFMIQNIVVPVGNHKSQVPNHKQIKV